MSRVDDLIEQIRELAGTPSEIAAVIGVEKTDASYRRALKLAEENGILVAEGTTRDRRYRNPARPDVDGELFGCLPCTAQEFSRVGHSLGLHGKVLGARKLKLGIETYRGDDGKWWCRHVEGYTGPSRRSQPTGEQWARMSARASKGGKTIAGKAKGDA